MISHTTAVDRAGIRGKNEKTYLVTNFPVEQTEEQESERAGEQAPLVRPIRAATRRRGGGTQAGEGSVGAGLSEEKRRRGVSGRLQHGKEIRNDKKKRLQRLSAPERDQLHTTN